MKRNWVIDFASTLLGLMKIYILFLEIERLRKAIREEIRLHKKYEKQLDDLDLQIGLLVRNRINAEVSLKIFSSSIFLIFLKLIF